MVAVQAKLILKPTIYVEVKAKNRKDAIKRAAWAKREALKGLYDKDFWDEVNLDYADAELEKDVKLIAVGPSSEYYNTKE
jgi:hypothetical protein